MNKVTKKELARKIKVLEGFVDYADSMLTQLNHALPEPLEIKHWRDERADYDEVIAILDAKEPKLKQLYLVELTGSDYYHSGIASKLLERGQKLVVCFVSNASEADALNKKDIEVITSLDTEFNDADDYGWQFVVPINNQGEPLTAADVGL